MQLKPLCTELSQLALRFKAKKATGKQIINSIESLYQVLRDISQDENVLDHSLADYAFFPLSIIFRGSKELPVRAVEVALKCLRILIAYGWRNRISPDLGKQLLILLAFLAGGNHAGGNVKDVNEELATAAFECLKSLFDSAVNAGLGSPESVEPDNIPVLGHAISVVLDGIAEGPSATVRAAALSALNSMIGSIKDNEVLRRFVPGIISSLTRLIRPGGGSLLPFKIIQSSLRTLERLLNKVISDHPAHLSSRNDQQHQSTTNQGQQVDTWVQASSEQIKLALANIIPLQYHERSEVRRSLFDLFMSILQNCRKSLFQSIPMITETMIAICAQKSSSDTHELLNQARTVISYDSDISEIVRSSLHDWIVALPRIMQSSDDTLKQRGIARISTAFEIISAQNMTSDVLQNAMVFNLRSSVLTALQTDYSPTVHSVSEGSLEVTKMLQSSGPGQRLMTFRPVLFGASSQKTTLDGLHTLAKQLRVLPMSSVLQRGVLESLRTTSGEEQLANLWLCLQLLNNETDEAHEVDQYLNLPLDEDTPTPLTDEAYSFALDVLSESSFEKESANWRLQALSLEVIALQAYHQKQDFRPELVDALYPILERLGSSNAALQSHAMTCLNLVSNYCAYTSPGALIVANADYLVNAVALKLNTFEVSPQAPLVLVMMVKLCGPALVPYLDDLVETIFIVLACFHGYPRLVESLFSVLHAIVEESGKTPYMAIGSSSFAPRRQPAHQPITIAALADRLRQRNAPPPSLPPSPEYPDSPPFQSDPPPEAEDQPLPAPIALLHSIAVQTQNHLTSPSTPLLLSLLSLLSHAFPPLSPYSTQLLPLLATLFPVLLTRLLQFPLPQICIAACSALVAACEAGGDFLASRVYDEWAGITKTCKHWETEMQTEERIMGKTRRGIKGRAWEAITKFVVTVVEVVGVTSEMEDDVFDLLGETALEEQQKVLLIGRAARGKIVSGAGGSSSDGGGGENESGTNQPDTSSSHSATLLNCLRALNPDALWLLEMQKKTHASPNLILVPPTLEFEYQYPEGSESEEKEKAEGKNLILKDLRF